MTEEPNLVRFAAEFTEGDGRTIDAKLVPYNTPATVRDADGPAYREMFLPGAFERQTSAPDRVKVLMNFEHEQGIGGVVGRGISLTDDETGLHGTFRMLDTQDADKALELVHAGVLGGLSIEFAPKTSRTVQGVTQRIRAHLDKVSLCRSPAYADAQVVAVREEPPVPAETLPGPSAEILDRLAAHGVTPILVRAVTRKPWDGSAARFTDDEYAKSCLICRGASDSPKQDCSLPVLEPNGDLNVNAMMSAAGRLNQTQGLTPAQKAAAARKLRSYYTQAQMEPSAMITMMAAK